MRSKQKSAFETGIMSMSGYLAEIATSSKSINELLGEQYSFSGKDTKSGFSTKAFNSVLKYQNAQTTLLREISTGINDLLTTTKELLFSISERAKSRYLDNQPKNISFTNNINFDSFQIINDSKFMKNFEHFSKLIKETFDSKIVKTMQGVINQFKDLAKIIDDLKKNEQIFNRLQDFSKVTIVMKDSRSALGRFGLLAKGVTLLTVALIGMNYVDWQSPAKLLVFLAGLFGILALYQKMSGSGVETGLTGSIAKHLFAKTFGGLKGAFGFVMMGIGIAVLAFALSMFNNMSWAGAFGLIAFLGILVATIKMSTLGPNNAVNSVVKLTLSLGLLALVIQAFNEVEWSGILKFIAVIMTLGITMFVVNKLSSGKQPMMFKGMRGTGLVGFAIGLVLLVLAVDAFNELSWGGAMAMLAFIVALGLAISAPALMSKRATGGLNTSGILGFAFGMALMVLVIDAFSEVSWIGAFKLLTFIAAFGLVLRAFPKSVLGGSQHTMRDFKNGVFTKDSSPIIKIAMSMVIFSIALWVVSNTPINPANVFLLLTMMVSSALIFKMLGKYDMKTVLKVELMLNLIAFSLLILGVVYSIISYLPLDYVNFTIIVAATGLMLYMMNQVIKNLKDTKELKSKILTVVFSVVTISVMIWTVGTFVKPEMLIGIGIVIAGYILMEKFILNRLQRLKTDRMKINAISIGASLIILAGSMLVATALGLATPLIMIFAIGFMIVNKFIVTPLSRINPASMVKSLITATLIGISLIALAVPLVIISMININFVQVLSIVGTIGLLSILMVGLGFLIAPITLGAVAIGIIGLSIIAFAGGLMLLSQVNIDNDKISSFGNSILQITKTFAGLILYAAAAVVGAVLVTPVIVSSIVVAGLLLAISKLEINSANIDSFKNGLIGVISAYSNIGIINATKAVATALLVTPIILLSVIASGVLFMLSKIELNERNFTVFKSGIKLIVDSFNQFGVVEAVKAGGKSVVLMPLLVAGLAAAYIMEKISTIEIKQSQMDAFAGNIDLLLDTMVDAVNRSQQKLKDAGPGIEALAKLTGVGTNLVDIMIKMANGTYVEYEVKDGKIVPKAVKQIDYNKLSGQIGDSFGNLIQGLTQSLTAIDDSKATWKVGRFTIPNPFKGKNDSKLKAIEKLGNAFLPLTDIISNLSNIELFKNKELLTNFNNGLGGVIDSVVKSMSSLNESKFDSIDMNIERLGKMTNNLDKLQKMQFDKYNNGISVFMGNLSDEGKWNRITKNIDKTGTSIAKIVKTINSIDLPKARTLESSLKYLSQKNDAANIIKVLNKVCDMIGSLRITQDEGLNKIREILESGIVPNMSSGANYGDSGTSDGTNSGSNAENGGDNQLNPKQKTAGEMLRDRAIPVIIVNTANEPVPVDDIENGMSKNLSTWNKDLGILR